MYTLTISFMYNIIVILFTLLDQKKKTKENCVIRLYDIFKQQVK